MEKRQPPDCDTILWPLQVNRSGFFYGWTYPLICVAGIVQTDTRECASKTLQNALTSDMWPRLEELGAGRPHVLGYCSLPLLDTQDSLKDQPPELRFDTEVRSSRYVQSIVYYKRPNRAAMQYYSLDHRELDILPSRVLGSSFGTGPQHISAVLTHDFTRPSFSTQAALDATVFNQLNITQPLSELVDALTSGSDHNTLLSSMSPSLDHPSSTEDNSPPATSVYRTRDRQWFTSINPVLRVLSVTAEQVDVRMEQASFVFTQAATFFRRNSLRSVKSITQYVKFYNCIWLVLNDIIIGVAFGSFLCENDVALAHMLEQGAQYYLVDCMHRSLIWLNSWPAGLKLNTELSQFYCNSLLGVISMWGQALQYAAPYYPALFWMMGIAGCCGMTMIVSLLSDVFGLLTAHLHLCYYLTTVAFSQELSLAGSLWNLFRGKRFNVLRNRLDSWDYDVDQLLLGTILFTLVTFLYPTVLTYYALFAMTHLSSIMVHAILDTAIALLNHFPLFALMLRVKDPMRLPGQIVFRRLQGGSLLLENQPAPLSSIFMHYAHLWSRLSSHYNPLRLLRLLMSGRRLIPIPRAMIRFSMIPDSEAVDR